MDTVAKKDGRRKAPSFTPEQIGAHAGALTSNDVDILLGWANGWSYADLVLHLDIKLGTVRSRLNRARLKLMPLVYKHPNGAPMYAPDGTMLDENGNRSIFDDVDE